MIFEISRDRVNFLDMEIFKGERFRLTGQLDFMNAKKATSISLPLAFSSMHAPHIHKCWPRSVIARTRSLCSSPDLGNRCADEYIRFLESHGIRYTDSSHKPLRQRRQHRTNETLRIQLAYIPAWVGLNLSRLFARLCRSVYETSGLFFTFGISWTLGNRRWAHLIRDLENYIERTH